MTMSLDDSICAYFVNNLKSSDNNEPDTLEQFETALKLMGEKLPETQIRQIKPSEGYPLIAAGNLTKRDVFVLAQFEGDFFQQLQMTKALILGPPCLVSCLRQNKPVPLANSAIYTTAMRDMLVSATGVTPQKKEELSKLIKWMGGVYFQSFGHTTTHLISNTIKSHKYEQATLNGVPVMHVDWVQCVWDQSRKRNRESLVAGDAEFDKYCLPTFFGANITCSGLDVARKEQVMRLVNENGGIYHRAFRSQVVDIVITEQSKTDTDKYKAAIRYKKDVLLPEWIFDSHSRGYALPTKKYEVRAGKKVSTPTKSSRSGRPTGPSDQTLSDLSRISFVSGSGRMLSDLSTVNETLSSPSKQLLKQATTAGSARSYQQVLADICPRQAKMAGPLLDGCCVYLSGFRAEEREKLNRILNTGGATRYDEANEGISHIIVGQLDDAEYRQWQRDGLIASVHVVRLEWLLESIRCGRTVNELAHRASLPQTGEPDVASPASKRTLRSMNHSFKQPKQLPIKKKLFGGEPETQPEQEQQEQEKPQEQELLNQYSQDQEPAAQLPPTTSGNTEMSMLLHPAASSTQVETRPAASNRPTAAELALALPDLSASTLSIEFDKLDYLSGLSVYVHKESLYSEFYNQVAIEIETAQGLLVPESFTDEVDYAIVTFEMPIALDKLPVRARHVVNELFIESCMRQNKLLTPEYYHLPVPYAAGRQPLRGMTIVVSIYAGLERDFIGSVADILGATSNKTFIKKDRQLLVCPKAEGSKYEGAIKWHYPVVTAAWLVQCAQTGEKLPYVDYLVGKSSPDFPTISPRLKENNLRTPRRQEQQVSELALEHQPAVEEAENQPDVTHIPVATAAVVVPSVPELTPLRNRRVSELAGGRRASSSSSSSPTDSPRTPTNQGYSQGYNFEFLEEFVQRLDTDEGKDCVRQIIREMRENQTPELERIRRQACTPVSHQHPRPAPGIPEFCLTPEFKQRMADDFERRWRLPTHKIQPDTPISVIRKRVMRITCETLGIDYGDMQEDEQEEEQQKKQKLNFERKSPKTPKVTVPKVPKKATPPRLSVSSPGVGSPSTSNFVPNTQSPVGAAAAESTINFDKISFEETTAAVAAAGPEPLNCHNSPDVKQITDYLKQCESRRNSLKRSHDSHMESAESEVQFVQPFESEGFALGTEDTVDWRDPGEFNAAKRRSSGSPRMQHAGTPCFSISCGDDEEKRAELIERIQQLGGKLCENLVNYDETCTHLLCERPNRGEKMLACIAAGKWILNIQYIDQCHTRGHFLDEAQYEWGNPRALNLPTMAPEESLIAVAAHRWRTELSASGGGAFSAHRVILSLHERSGAAIRNVMRAGGACILEPASPFAQDPLAATATDCFVDIKKAPLPPKDLAHLKQCRVRIYTQLAINYYLMHGREANLEKYEVK